MLISVSKCCHAPAKIMFGDGDFNEVLGLKELSTDVVTTWMECTKCLEPCDWIEKEVMDDCE